MGVNVGGMDPTGMGSYSGYPGSKYWNVDSRPLSEATSVLRSFVITNIVQDSQWEIDRMTRYYLFWKFYEGLHWKDFNDGMISFNYVRAFIDKVNMFLLGNEAFSFQVKSYYSDQIDDEIEKVAEELMMYHWGKSNKSQLAYEILQMGSITGDCWIGASWQGGEFEKYVKIKVFDSRQCFPVFKNGDYSVLERFLVRQPLDSNKEQPYKLFVMQYTDSTIETWYQKDVTLNDSSVTKYEHEVYENEYGFIPIVHIKNKPNSAKFYGTSDANDILKLNKVYNEMNQQLKAVIDYHVTPTTVITGASAKSLKKGLGQIWSGLPAEANVFNLGLDVDLSAALEFIKDIKTAMHELSDVPENALGKIQAISNTSAAALQITYHPLLQQANVKAMTYGEGITEMNSMILRILEVEDPKNSRLKQLKKLAPNFRSEMRIVPVFAYGFPKDRMDELNRAEIELRLKLGSRKEIMERMGKQNIDALMEQIDDDTLHQALLQAKLQEALGGVPPAPGVNPEDNPDAIEEPDIDSNPSE